jgi:hypothetical protein
MKTIKAVSVAIIVIVLLISGCTTAPSGDKSPPKITSAASAGGQTTDVSVRPTVNVTFSEEMSSYPNGDAWVEFVNKNDSTDVHTVSRYNWSSDMKVLSISTAKDSLSTPLRAGETYNLKISGFKDKAGNKISEKIPLVITTRNPTKATTFFPANNTQSVGLRPDILLTFDHDMTDITFNLKPTPGGFLIPMKGNGLAAKIADQYNQVLQPDTKYQITNNEALTDVDGAKVDPFGWSFSTRPATKMVSHSPEGSLVDVSAPIVIKFNYRVNTSWFNNHPEVLIEPSIKISKIEWNTAKDTVTLTPEQYLDFGTKYTIRTGVELRDFENISVSEQIWNFTTRAPNLQVVGPGPNVCEGGDNWTMLLVSVKSFENYDIDFQWSVKKIEFMNATGGVLPLAPGEGSWISAYKLPAMGNVTLIAWANHKFYSPITSMRLVFDNTKLKKFNGTTPQVVASNLSIHWDGKVFGHSFTIKNNSTIKAKAVFIFILRDENGFYKGSGGEELGNFLHPGEKIDPVGTSFGNTFMSDPKQTVIVYSRDY